MSTTSYELSVQVRSELGRNASRRARHAGMIPAVVYSHGKESETLFVDSKEWAALSSHDFNLVTLNNGTTKVAALVKEVQVNYLKGQVLHIDFQEVNANEAITTTLAIHATGGDPVGLSQGGVLEQNLHEVEVKSLPANLPEALEADVSTLEIEKTLCAKDLVLPEGVELLSNEKLVIFAVIKPAATASAEAAAEEEENTK
jgi:large subunit ribosomal protein L25